ncbi:MAG: hypothetical protein KC502_19715 [Myxococcales bacterium]|nr:hypothetical protein [Myxococcales bacterium]
MRHLILVLAILQAGCLGPSYVIPRAEIARLERAPATQRNNRLHVIQRFSTADTPPPAPAWQAPQPPPTTVRGARVGVAPAWTRVWLSPGSPTFRPRWAAPGVRMGARTSMGTTVRPSTPVRGRGPTPSSPSVSSGSSGDSKAMLVAVLAAGIAVGVGLAVTEGARYDGWVAVHPHHPVHLMGARGRHRIVPLNQLTLASLAPDEEAVVVRHEGAGLWEIGRRPLSRGGFTYAFDLGTQRAPLLDGRIAALSGGALRIGAFANDWLGVLPGIDIAVGDVDGRTATVVTPHIQLVVAPLRLWRLHLGAFGEMGWSAASIDAVSKQPSGMRMAMGVLLQWEITTRLALDFRWSNRWLREDGTRPSTSFTTGLSIY